MINSGSFNRNYAGQRDIFKVLKKKNLQPRSLYLAKISFRIDGEIKSFMDKQKLREFSTTKPTLQKILKGNTRERKDLQKQTQNNQENASRNICINNYLKCKWIKCSNQEIQTD